MKRGKCPTNYFCTPVVHLATEMMRGKSKTYFKNDYWSAVKIINQT
jgi:hypothetical protein